MLTSVRNLRIVLFTLLTSLPAATALAQSADGAAEAGSPATTILVIAFCSFVVGSLAYTARRMARLP